MLREVCIFSIVLLYIESILQLYVLFQIPMPFIVFISSVALIGSAFIISNMTSLVWIFRGDQKPSVRNKTVCVILHVLQLGPIWRLVQIFVTGYDVEREIIILRFIHCGIQTIPYLLIHGSVDLQGLIYHSGGVLNIVVLLISSLSLAISYSLFSLKHSLVSCDNSGALRFSTRCFGVFLICFGTFLMLATRLATIMFMTAVVSFWTALPIGFHFIIIFFTYMTCTRDLTWKIKSCRPWNLCRYSILSFFHVFEMLEINFTVIQCKYVAFYALILVENIIMSAIWLLYSDKDYLTKLITVVFLLLCYVSALIAKYSGCYVLTRRTEPPEKVSETKSSIHIDKRESQCTKSKSFSRNRSSLHHTTSTESHTTETIISRGTSGVTHKTDLDYESLDNRLMFTQFPSSVNSKTSSSKFHKSFKKKSLLGQTNSLFNYPNSSTHRSCSSIPGTVFVSSINDSDKDPPLCASKQTKRVTGRRGFKLGQPRPYTIHGGIFLDDSYLNSRTHLRNPNLQNKIQRTHSMFVDDTGRPEAFQKLNVTNLAHHPAWYSNSLTDSCSLHSDDDDDLNDEETSRTSSSNTKLTVSSNDQAMWNTPSRPSFENLDRLPTKTIETEKRIKSWLSETVNIFDLLHEKTHEEQWTIRRPDGKPFSVSNMNTPVYYEQYSPKGHRLKNNVTKSHSTRNIGEQIYQRPDERQTKDDFLEGRRKSTGSRLRGHKNSLKEIDKLKQFIRDNEIEAGKSKTSVHVQTGRLDLQKYRLSDRIEKRFEPERIDNVVKQTSSFPQTTKFEQSNYTGNHRPLISVESLV